jgi:4'-phosphopantetheinyl transferase
MAKDNDGVPLPANGWFWSVSHKPSFVAGVAGTTPLGIDIESVRPRSRNLFHKIADRKEWQLGGEDEWQLFYRFWTAKEAVLKAVGIGMRGLSDCRIVAVKNPHHLTLSYRGEIWQVRQSMAHGHLAALAQNDRPVRWRWPVMGQTHA